MVEIESHSLRQLSQFQKSCCVLGNPSDLAQFGAPIPDGNGAMFASVKTSHWPFESWKLGLREDVRKEMRVEFDRLGDECLRLLWHRALTVRTQCHSGRAKSPLTL